jgi:hypothetical protein
LILLSTKHKPLLAASMFEILLVSDYDDDNDDDNKADADETYCKNKKEQDYDQRDQQKLAAGSCSEH